MKHLAPRLLAAALCLMLLPAASQTPEAVTSARMLPGWRMADGTHMAALELHLAPGWKTYWRAPGDIGIPPRFDWRGSRNLQGVAIEWPTPQRIDQGGLASIGYHGSVVLPLHVLAQKSGRDVALNGTIEIGVCQNICIPMTLKLRADLPVAASAPDPRILAALADRPLSAAEAGVRNLRCTLTPGMKGRLNLRAELSLPALDGPETAVIETGDPNIWVAAPRLTRQGNTVIAETTMAHAEGRIFALDRSKLRLTILGAQQAVDVKGCPGS